MSYPEAKKVYFLTSWSTATRVGIFVHDLILLGIAAFLAGFVDAVVGGGGLIQLPALLVLFPHLAIATLFGTNKVASIAGTSAAALQYARQIVIPWQSVLPGAIAAGICSFLGARTVQFLQPSLLRPLVLVLLTGVGLYTYVQKDFGAAQQPKIAQQYQAIATTIAGGAIGFYDGFFGPGTGSFLIFAFIGISGFDFLTASASAKVLNWATNFAALVAFVSAHQVLYFLAIPMAICNVAGSLLGSRLAILKGNGFIRGLFLSIVSVLIVKLAYDTFAR
jgi:uncharacterized protein